MNLEQKNLIVFSMEQFQNANVQFTAMINRLARKRQIIYFQTPIFGVATDPSYLIQKDEEHLMIVQPYVPEDISIFDQKDVINEIIHDVLLEEHIEHYSIWTDTAKAMPFIRELNPEVLVYDGRLAYLISNPELENELSIRADLVLRPGKQNLH